MDRRVITYIIISIIAAILLGDLWVLHMQLDGIHKMTKTDDKVVKQKEQQPVNEKTPDANEGLQR